MTYALVPATSGAWGEGRFGTVAVAALLPWTAHAALGFADPDRDRRWRAAWRTALLVALGAAFVPGVWLFALLAAAIVLGAGRLHLAAAAARPAQLGPARGRAGRGAGAAGPVVAAPGHAPAPPRACCSRPAGSRADRVDVGGLLTGRLGDLGAPWWLGALVGLLALLALLPRATRVPVLGCWLVALVAVGRGRRARVRHPAAAGHPDPAEPGPVRRHPPGRRVVATVLGAEAYLSRLHDGQRHPRWQRVLAGLLAVVAAVVPLGGLVWWLASPDDDALTREEQAVVPAYMEQSALLGDEHGVLVLRGSVAEGIDYRILRGDGVTLGEDEVLALADEDAELTEQVRRLVSAPTRTVVESLARVGVEYVVLPSPADGTVAAGLDATSGLDQASAENRSTRAWQVDRPLGERPRGSRSWFRVGLLVLQGVAILVVLVLCAPSTDRDREGGRR